MAKDNVSGNLIQTGSRGCLPGDRELEGEKVEGSLDIGGEEEAL